MDLKELRRKLDLLRSYDLNNPIHMDDFYDNIYMPVRKAIANNDKEVIDFIFNCNAQDQHNLYTAVKAGAIDNQHSNAIELYEKIRSDNNFKIDDRIGRPVAV